MCMARDSADLMSGCGKVTRLLIKARSGHECILESELDRNGDKVR